MSKIKVELHTHTNYSYDTNLSFEKIIEKCKKEGIKAIAITDHNQIEGAQRLAKMAPFKVIVGEEIFTKEGEIIGLFLNKYIKPGLTLIKTISEIRRQNGLVYIPHPFDKTTRKTSIKENLTKEILNKADIVEVHNGRTLFELDNKKAKNLTKSTRKIPAVGSDAHTIYEFGRNYILMEDFNSSTQFLLNLKKGTLIKKRVMPWVFLITKLVRFSKKHYKFLKFDYNPNIKCDLCGSNRYSVVYKKSGRPKRQYFISDDSYGVHPQIIKCFDCGLEYCYPRDQEKSVLKRYSDFIDLKYENERNARKENQSKILKELYTILGSKGKILDIGAATGAFVETANENGWEAEGLEPSKWAVKYALEKYGVKIEKGVLPNKKFKNYNFDAISLIDVIEHVDSPRKLLEQVKILLKKDGILVVVTPDKDSLMSRLLGERWWHIRPDHIYYFNIKTVKLLAESIGFEIVKVKRASWKFSYSYWISRFKKHAPFLYRFLKYLENWPELDVITKKSYGFNFHDSWEIYLRNNE